jgi:hypothetical protein
MIFALCALVFMMVGRKAGWAISKPLYFAPVAAVCLFSLSWGAVVAGSIRGLVLWQEPGAVLRWILGYALGGYVAIPNYGLLDESTIPQEAMRRHLLLKTVPLITYAACSIALAYV